MINGDGFFAVQDLNGDMMFTRNGSFVFAMAQEGFMLSTAEGYPVLSSDGSPIILTEDYNAADVTVDGDGNLCYPDEMNNPSPIGIKIAVYQFTNPSGLEKVGSTYLKESDASGIPLNEDDGGVGTKSTIKQGYLEASNVNVATEMVNLITAQRAYELCSKAITTSDTMMEQANNLKR
jgi:flagellar basal-body rod protein FlgG